MIRLEDFRPVTLKDQQLFKSHYSRFPQHHSEYLYTTLVSWSHYTPAFYLFKEDNLILMTVMDAKPQFRPPVGERSESVLEEVIYLARKEGGVRPIVAIEEQANEWIGGIYPKIKMTADRNFFDYVYLAKNLAELPGKPYLTQRSHLNRFRKRYGYSVEQITSSNMSEVDFFLKRWCKQRDCESEPLLEAEVAAITFCMAHYFELEVSGIVLRIDGEVQALSVYEPINDETAAIHFEKAMPGYDGIYPAINNEAAKILAKDYMYINRESDLGIPGLRTAKERLHPDHMVKVYYVEREDL
jgi:hypothetical protein